MTDDRPPQPAAEGRCAACAREAEATELARCAICRRLVCARCLGAYGHHMLACDDCRLEPW